jgi:hypothetical protein
MRLHGNNGLDWYFLGARFESRPEHRVIQMSVFWLSTVSPGKYRDIVGYGHTPFPSKLFSIHHSYT